MATGINPLGGERAQLVQKKNIVKPWYLRGACPGSLIDHERSGKT
jgi:hypothetical protein